MDGVPLHADAMGQVRGAQPQPGHGRGEGLVGVDPCLEGVSDALRVVTEELCAVHDVAEGLLGATTRVTGYSDLRPGENGNNNNAILKSNFDDDARLHYE